MILHAITHAGMIYILCAESVPLPNEPKTVYANVLTKQVTCPIGSCFVCALGAPHAPITEITCYHNFMKFMRTHAPEVLDKYPECFL